MAVNESIGNTLRVAFAVCLVCAVVVSTAAVTLRPAQEANRMQFRQVNILQTAGMYERGTDVSTAFERIERRFVELQSGEFVERPDSYDQQQAARDPEQSRALEYDPAGIRRQALVAEVYLARGEDGRLESVVLPVHGYGLWSTMYGFIALERDLDTVSGLRFYEHGETPGLGGEIDNPRWIANWEGKEVFDDSGNLAIEVLKGQAPAGSDHQVDGLSGATLTARGVNNLVRFWMGEDGFGPFLDQLRDRIEAGEYDQAGQG
jgi:Na+-transporting NADH:ubiquinone oxidoreductase subunit C